MELVKTELTSDVINPKAPVELVNPKNDKDVIKSVLPEKNKRKTKKTTMNTNIGSLYLETMTTTKKINKISAAGFFTAIDEEPATFY